MLACRYTVSTHPPGVIQPGALRNRFARQGQAAWRWTASWVALGLLGVGLLMIAVTRRKQGLHDLLAGTVVLRHLPGSSVVGQ